MKKENIIKDLEDIRYAIGKWSNERIKKNIDRIITEYRENYKGEIKTGKMLCGIGGGPIVIDTDVDGSIYIYSVKK